MQGQKLQLSQEQNNKPKIWKKLKILRLRQNYLVLIKMISVSDKHAQTSNVV